MQLFLFILTEACQVSLKWKKYWNLVAATKIIKHLRLTTELISPLWLLPCRLVVHSKLSVKAASLCWTKPQRHNMKTNRNFMEYGAGLNGTSCSSRAISGDPSSSLAVRSPAPPRPCQGCPGDQIWLCGCSVLWLACKVADVEALRQFLSWRIPLQQAAEWPRCFFFSLSVLCFVSATWSARQPESHWKHGETHNHYYIFQFISEMDSFLGHYSPSFFWMYFLL